MILRNAASLLFCALALAMAQSVFADEEVAVTTPRRGPINFPASREHWSYRPIASPAIPTVKDKKRVQNPIDAFVLQKLEAKGLTYAPQADKRALIRRVYYDLIGLPPTFEETEAFVKDRSRDAYDKVVERLLASPRYGERWGRHWLDVARYADTKDQVLVYGKDRIRPYAYTYRDYVIRAFNEDMPFDQFVKDQLAADQIEPKVEPWRLAALGLLTLGRMYDGNQHDQLDDQIDTVTRGFLGLTVACARCHDHKYDAIPTDDYYSLYGVFASSEKPYDLPLLDNPESIPGGVEFEKKLAAARKTLEEHVDAEYVKQSLAAKLRIEDYLVRVATTKPDLAETAVFGLSLTPDALRPPIVLRWRRFVEQRAKPEDPIFGLWAQLMETPEAELPARAKQLAATSQGNPVLAKAFAEAMVTNKAAVASLYGKVLRGLYDRFEAPSTNAAHATPSADEAALLALLTSKESPGYFAKSQTHNYMARVEQDRYGGLVQELDKVVTLATNTPPRRAMVVRDTPELYQPRVFIRGSPARPGREVPRAFPQILAGTNRAAFAHGSGRLDLGEAIASPQNPLTARVYVNRVWMEHFGEPLVATPSDFGARAEPPVQKELLDYLAARFMADGWSVKKLHRLILSSACYQQASSALIAGKAKPVNSVVAQFAKGEKVDPDNKLLWFYPRRRLDFEAIRDTLLTVSGRIENELGGRPVDVEEATVNRRTVYALVDRQDLPGMFRAFDFACPDQSVERRSRTTVPQQALFVMNSPFALTQARALAARTATARPEERVKRLYQYALARLPEKEEIRQALQFVNAAGSAAPSPLPEPKPEQRVFTGWEQFAQALLMSNELMFVE